MLRAALLQRLWKHESLQTLVNLIELRAALLQRLWKPPQARPVHRRQSYGRLCCRGYGNYVLAQRTVTPLTLRAPLLQRLWKRPERQFERCGRVTGTFAAEVMETLRQRPGRFLVGYGHLCCRGYGNLKGRKESYYRFRYGHLCCRGYGNSRVSTHMRSSALRAPLLQRLWKQPLFHPHPASSQLRAPLLQRLWKLFSGSSILGFARYGHLCCRGYGNRRTTARFHSSARYGRLCCRGYGNDGGPRDNQMSPVSGGFAAEVMETGHDPETEALASLRAALLQRLWKPCSRARC